MKKKLKKKGSVKTLRNLGTVVNLKDGPTEVMCHMPIPVMGDCGDRSSRILAPISKTMPVIPPNVACPRAPEHYEFPGSRGSPLGTPADHTSALVALAKTIAPTAADLAKAKVAKFRSDQLEKLDEILSGRRSNHGSPEDNFAKIAEAWNMWRRWKGLPGDIGYSDVPIFMTLLKLVREASGHGDQDNGLDAAGYLLIYNQLTHSKP